jgi:hypothetical protein
MRTPRPNLTVERPTTERARAVAQRAAEKIGQGSSRLVADIPDSLHRKIKIRAVERGQTVREYLIGLLANDGLTE